MLIVTLLCSKLFVLRNLLKSATLTNANDDYCEIFTPDKKKDGDLKTPKLIKNTYSELDIYSTSSGFGSEGSKHEDVESDSVKSNMENVYETAESVRLKKQAMNSQFRATGNSEESYTYTRAIKCIDETLKLLKESAEQL